VALKGRSSHTGQPDSSRIENARSNDKESRFLSSKSLPADTRTGNYRLSRGNPTYRLHHGPLKFVSRVLEKEASSASSRDGFIPTFLLYKRSGPFHSEGLPIPNLLYSLRVSIPIPAPFRGSLGRARKVGETHIYVLEMGLLLIAIPLSKATGSSVGSGHEPAPLT
jgi:hypothetical protein